MTDKTDSPDLGAIKQDIDARFLLDQNLQMSDRMSRMELALRMIRFYAMQDGLIAESGGVREWLRDWIDGRHTPPGYESFVGGPLIWPKGLPGVCPMMTSWGFKDGKGYVVIDPAKMESVQ